MRGVRRAPVVAVLVLLALVGCGEDEPARRSGHDPIVFVHGLGGGPGGWDVMRDRFAADGWTGDELRRFSYDSSRSNVRTAQLLRDEVDDLLRDTGARRVDVITHSMGGLSSRWWLKRLGGTAKVDAWVSLGGPNHGLDRALCDAVSCAEMRAGSPFERALNAGDETPGRVRYGTWWSRCDEIIRPVRSTPLRGARNTRTACLDHNALTTDATVYAEVRDFVDG
ncbi:MAG: triacylglycerol lipase [Solirubrobacterales bacterium]|nr:triacylglycerol lipase [Solirubrobacterales bacterium]